MKISLSSKPKNNDKPEGDLDITAGFVDISQTAKEHSELMYAGDFSGRKLVTEFLTKTKPPASPDWSFLCLEEAVDDNLAKMRVAFSRIRSDVFEATKKKTTIRLKHKQEMLKKINIKGINFCIVTITREDTAKKNLDSDTLKALKDIDIKEVFDAV